jgi:hypothetical protein
MFTCAMKNILQIYKALDIFGGKMDEWTTNINNNENCKC